MPTDEVRSISARRRAEDALREAQRAATYHLRLEENGGARSPKLRDPVEVNRESTTLATSAFHAVISPLPTSAPDRIRTCDLRFRRPTLYPAELRALAGRG